MRRQRLRVLVLIVLVAVLANTVLVGQDSAQDEFASTVNQLADLLDQALYLAISGFSSYAVDDHQAAAQGLINLLEGPQGESYDETAAVTTERGIGDFFSYFLRVDWPFSSLDELGSDLYVVRDAIAHGSEFLGLAHEAALEARDTREGPMGARDALRVVYACLLAVRGGLDGPFLVAGIHQLAELFSEDVPLAEEDLVQLDGHLQRLLERSSPGDEILLGEGVFRERVVITQSITIEGESREETILEGVAWDAVLTLTSVSDEPIQVVLKNLSVRGGSTGVIANGPVTLTLDNVVLTDNQIGLAVRDGASVEGTNVRFVGKDRALSASIPGEPSQVSLSDCLFDANESAVDIDGQVAVSLNSCILQGGTDPDGDIRITSGAALNMHDSQLHRTAGRAIVFDNTVSMALVANVIETAYDYAISMFSSECGRFNRTSDLPEGTISGYGNTIQSGVCPATLLFLGDPQPDELRLSPGQSVQAAIDRIVDGGVITLREGTYCENLDIGKPLTLVGLGDVTLVPDNQENPVIRLTGSTDIVVQNIRVEDAATGIEVTQANCHILGCRIDGADQAIKVIAFGGDVVLALAS